jgi:putative sporulation protein YtxC
VVDLRELTILKDESQEAFAQLKGSWQQWNNIMNLELDENNQYMTVKVKLNNKDFLLHTMSSAIIEHYENKILRRIININYNYLSDTEKYEVYQISKELLCTNENINTLKSLILINKKLDEFIETNEKIILEGFANFRLKEYVDNLEDVADRAMDDFLVQKEYREFIRLLRHFVDMQSAQEKIIHIIINNNSDYKLLNGKKEDITKESQAELLESVKIRAGGINYDDLLISSLITLSPQILYFHRANIHKNQELVQTIRSVFGEKMVECDGCDLCLP